VHASLDRQEMPQDIGGNTIRHKRRKMRPMPLLSTADTIQRSVAVARVGQVDVVGVSEPCAVYEMLGRILYPRTFYGGGIGSV
jgi:hypothetical protein